MPTNPYMTASNPYMEIGKKGVDNPYMALEKPKKGLTKPAPALATEMMTKIVGLDKPAGVPFKASHPNIYAAGKTALAMPGLVAKAATSVISGATWSLPERAEEAGNWLARKLFGEGRKGGATGSWEEEEAKLPSFMEKPLRFAGSMLTIGTLGKGVAAPIISAVIKHRHFAPFARMIGWGAAGMTYQAGEQMLGEGELPTPKELVKYGATWAAIEGAMSSLGWTGRLAIGINRLSKIWTIPRKEVIKMVIKEAKSKGMPIAKYAFTKAKVQKALSLKETVSAKELLNVIDDIPKQFKKQGTYTDLVKQLETKDVKGRIDSLQKHINKIGVVKQKVVPKPIQRIDMVKKGFTRTKKLTDDLPDWVKKVTGDIRYGAPVSKEMKAKYHAFFKARMKVEQGTIPGKPGIPKKLMPPKGDSAILKPPEMIMAKGAALKLEDGTIITAQTHAVAYQKALNKGLEAELDKGFGEGFMTTSGRFITRDEAQILYKANETNALLKKGVIDTGRKTLPKEIRGEVKGYPGYKEVTAIGESEIKSTLKAALKYPGIMKRIIRFIVWKITVLGLTRNK